MSRSPDPTIAFSTWLADARRGEAAGFAGLYDWLGPEVKRFVVGRGARDADAITNDAFVAAFRRLGDFDGDAAAFRSWVYSIARNKLIDAHRSDQRRPPVAGDQPAIDLAPAASAEDLVLDGLGHERAAELLACLSEAQQDVILLRVVNGLSLAETADAVRRPVSAVKRLQARGLAALRKKISDEGVSP
ncbi:MAG: RNA polymerase sigma factor [Actinomycetota bacterium]